MRFSLSKLNPSTRFYFHENGNKTENWVELRLASDDDNKRFFNSIGVKEKVTNVFNPKTRQMDRQTFFDTNDSQRDQFNEEVWDFSITDWNLLSDENDEDGEPATIPCNKENKIKFMRGSPLFATWIANCLENLRESLAGAGEAETKNF